MGHVMDQQQQSKACLNCPRCNSTNTKFCYYNNYSLNQPRHFCKACKRYWTRGGTLRNVPVGGGCRKNNKRVKRALLPDPTSSLSLVDDAPLPPSNQISQVPTSTLSAAAETPSNLLTPSFYSRYKDMIQQQQCNNFSDMNVNTNNEIPTDAFFFNNHTVEYQSIQNVDHPSSASAACHANTNLNNLGARLLGRLFHSQEMQQQQQPSSIVANYSHHHHQGDQQAQRWNANHVEHDPYNSSLLSWGGTGNTGTPWPPNHLANMDG